MKAYPTNKRSVPARYEDFPVGTVFRCSGGEMAKVLEHNVSKLGKFGMLCVVVTPARSPWTGHEGVWGYEDAKLDGRSNIWKPVEIL